MPTWIVYAGVATIIVTAGLTWILWRMNASADRAQQRRDKGDGDPSAAIMAAAIMHTDGDGRDRDDGHSGDESGTDGGGGADGGGSDGGGGAAK